jgi:mannan endo-1,6-alpha-mannosidase
MVLLCWLLVFLGAFLPSPAFGISLDIDDKSKFPAYDKVRSTTTNILTDSTLQAAAVIAHGVQEIYNGNKKGGTLGKWPFPPYYWWQSGGAWGGMIEYFHYTGDTSYMNATYIGLSSQLGPAHDFNMPAEAFDEGNDDQAFWVFAAMSAAEYSFPQPPATYPTWLQIVENAWQDFVPRWNSSSCNGGLKWQVRSLTNDFDINRTDQWTVPC